MFSRFLRLLAPIFLTVGGFSAQALEAIPNHLPSVPVEGPQWPTFSVYSKEMSYPDVQHACKKGRFSLAQPSNTPTSFLGCAVVSFSLRQCHYVFVKGRPDARRHERLHCQGLDHPSGPLVGEVSLSHHWERWNASVQQEIRTLQRRGVLDSDVVTLVVEKSMEADRAVLRRLGWPNDARAAKQKGWAVELNQATRP